MQTWQIYVLWVFSPAPKSHLSSHMFVPSSAINEHIYLRVADTCFLLSIAFNDSTLCSKGLASGLCSSVFLWLQKIRRRSHVCAIFFTQNRIYIAEPSGLYSSHKSPTSISQLYFQIHSGACYVFLLFSAPKPSWFPWMLVSSGSNKPIYSRAASAVFQRSVQKLSSELPQRRGRSVRCEPRLLQISRLSDIS